MAFVTIHSIRDAALQKRTTDIETVTLNATSQGKVAAGSAIGWDFGGQIDHSGSGSSGDISKRKEGPTKKDLLYTEGGPPLYPHTA